MKKAKSPNCRSFARVPLRRNRANEKATAQLFLLLCLVILAIAAINPAYGQGREGERASILNIDWKAILWQVVNFLIFLLILWRFLFKPVSNFMHKRSESIKNDIESAKAEREEAEKLHREYQERLRKIEDEALEIIRRAQEESRKAYDEVINEAYKEAAKIVDRAKETINEEKAKALSELRGEVGSLAVVVARRILTQMIDEKLQDKLVESFIERVGELSSSTRR
ncbi:MAG: F0F1 ATP synthase subunit B [bacterium]